MIKKIGIFLFFIFNLAAILYLVWPLPTIPDLTSSLKSTEEGDTIQMENVSGYFTDLKRAQVMAFYYQNYNFPLRIRLNHPPEKAHQIFRDTIQTYYLEELVIPFKQSLFINGYEWQNDVFTKPEKRDAYKVRVGERVYRSKVNTRTFTASIPQSLAAFFMTEFAALFILFALKRSFFKHP